MKEMNRLITALCLCGLATAASAGLAPPTTTYTLIPGSGQHTETRAYVGLNWKLGTAPGMPNVVLGVRTVKVKTNDDLSDGADLSMQFTTVGGFHFDRVRLLGIGGTRDGFYGLGFGYNYGVHSWLFSGAAGLPYARLIGDYTLGNGLDGFFQIETLAKPKQYQDSRCVVDPAGVYTDPACQTLVTPPPPPPPV
jgi:hypothetical protein